MNRRFGIEIECIIPTGWTRAMVHTALENAGVRMHGSAREANHAYSHAVTRGWKIVTDGSINGGLGAEIVSPVLQGDDGLAEARKVANALESMGCTVNTSCGLHVHVDVSDVAESLDRDHFRRLCLGFQWFEPVFDSMVPPSRRAGMYCMPFSADSDHRARIKGAASALRQFATDREFLNATTRFGDNRYYKLNNANLVGSRGFRTVEYRQHSGTVNADKIEHWARLVGAFTDKMLFASLRLPAEGTDLNVKYLTALLFSLINVPKATRDYVRARQAHFAGNERARLNPVARRQAAA